MNGNELNWAAVRRLCLLVDGRRLSAGERRLVAAGSCCAAEGGEMAVAARCGPCGPEESCADLMVSSTRDNLFGVSNQSRRKPWRSNGFMPQRF